MSLNLMSVPITREPQKFRVSQITLGLSARVRPANASSLANAPSRLLADSTLGSRAQRLEVFSLGLVWFPMGSIHPASPPRVGSFAWRLRTVRPRSEMKAWSARSRCSAFLPLCKGLNSGNLRLT
jgi:hypothetical protein